MCGQTLWAQTTNQYYSIDIYANSYAGGDGSKTNPYKIATAEQLAKLARDVNNGNTSQAFLGKYFKLTDDIDLSGGIWMPIGKYYNYGNGNGNNRLFSESLMAMVMSSRICIYNGKEPMPGVPGDSSLPFRAQATRTLLP